MPSPSLAPTGPCSPATTPSTRSWRPTTRSRPASSWRSATFPSRIAASSCTTTPSASTACEPGAPTYGGPLRNAAVLAIDRREALAARRRRLDNHSGGKHMQRRRMLIAGLAVAVGVAVIAPHAEAQTRLRYAHVGSEGDIQYWFAEEAAKKIPQATENRVTIQVFPNSQLGGVQEMSDGVKCGAISIGHHEFASLARRVKDIAVFNAPFVYRDGAHALAATDPRKSEVLQEFNQKLVSEGGMRIVGRLFRGARQMTAKQAVYSPADLQGKRFRGVPIQLWTTMIRGFGAIPTPVEVAELPTALMTGMVTGHMQNVLPVFVNERVWQSISEKDRTAILEGLEAIAQDTLKQAQKAEQELTDELRKKGMTFVTEKDGLKVAEFREKVSAEINKDFPTWKAYMDRIVAVK